ncbi:hypothetical protein HK104_006696, partial [Borealophlyctis nickersoniae]
MPDPPQNNPQFLSVGSLIIDDIVFPDKSLSPAQLGGGGTHALFGARIWLPAPLESLQAGYIAHVGDDCPPDALEKLKRLNVSLV